MEAENLPHFPPLAQDLALTGALPSGKMAD
jgi:hypothetical protein